MSNRLASALGSSVLTLMVLGASEARAQNCPSDGGCGFMECKTPAKSVPVALWGGLEPTDLSTLPIERDNTNFSEFAFPGHPADRYGSAKPFWVSLDIDSGYLYAAISHGLQIWDLRTSPTQPAFVKTMDGPSAFRQWPSGERKQVLADVAAVGDLISLVGQPNVGLTVVDVSDKLRPRLAYQDGDKSADQVYATTLNGRAYAFVPARSTVTGEATGLLTYDLTRARDYNSCLDNGGACPGVMVKQISTNTSLTYVDGVDTYVAASAGTGRGVSIWDVSNVLDPRLKLTALTTESVYGIAIWKDIPTGKYYLATRGDANAKIYDASCISTSNGCTGLGAPLWTRTMPSGTPQFYVTFSRAGSVPFIFFGSDQVCGSSGPTREFLFDVSNPASPRDVTPSQTIDVGGVAIDYWSWYYRGNPTGFNKTAGRMGKFLNDAFYRAAFSIFDVHKLSSGAPPLANFIVPAPIYAGAPVTFNDASVGTVTSRTWTFQDGTAPNAAASQTPKSALAAQRGGAKRVLLGVGADRRTVTLTNLTRLPIAVDLRFVPSEASAGKPERSDPGQWLEVAAGERRSISDLVARWGDGLGALIITPRGSDSPTIEVGSGRALLRLDDAAVEDQVWAVPHLSAATSKSSALVLWNPGEGETRVDLFYRGNDGAELGIVAGIQIPEGHARTIGPRRHPAAVSGRADFSIEVVVRSGRVLAAAQVDSSEVR